jgi:hypothetical protein
MPAVGRISHVSATAFCGFSRPLSPAGARHDAIPGRQRFFDRIDELNLSMTFVGPDRGGHNKTGELQPCRKF